MKNTFSMAEMIRDFQSHRRQIKALIRASNIPHELINGRFIVVDKDGYEAVRSAIESFRNRPVLSRLTKETVSA